MVTKIPTPADTAPNGETMEKTNRVQEKQKIFPILLIVAGLLGSGYTALAPAQSGGFANNSQGIIDGLSKPQPEHLSTEKRKTRGIKTRGIKTRGINTRGMQRVKTESGEALIMELPATSGSINLKIEFDVNSYAIRPGSLTLLDELGTALLSPKLRESAFIVGGHTDADGGDGANLQLSLNRARAVKGYLQHNHNITVERLKIVATVKPAPWRVTPPTRASSVIAGWRY